MRIRAQHDGWRLSCAVLVMVACAPEPVTETVDAEAAFVLTDALLIPEGIAYDPVTQAFFVGSTFKRKVVRWDTEGERDFVASGRDGVWGIVGMRVDAERRLLWLATSHAGDGMPMVEMNPAEEGRSGLFGYRIETGELAHYAVLDEGDHFLNDVVVAASGTVYVTDSQARVVYQYQLGTGSLETFADLSDHGGPNGIDFSEDETQLFVAVGRGIVRIDVPSAVVTRVLEPDSGFGVIDGLYVHGGDLIVVVPFGDRTGVARYRLDAAHNTVVEKTMLLEAHPRFEQPTTGVVVGDTLFVIANSHLQTFRAAWRPEGPDTTGTGLRAPAVLRVNLRRN